MRFNNAAAIYTVLILTAFFLSINPAPAYAQNPEPKRTASTGEVNVTNDSETKAQPAENEKKKEEKITWNLKYIEALKDAQNNKKPIMIFVYADWCGWCKKMERETYADKNIIKLTEKFVCIKIDSNESDESFEKFNVKEYPSILFLKSDATEIERHLGFKTTAEFEAILKKVIEEL